ncbi:phage major capsid protein [Streptococcus anginosus]|uniref:phage major capsid protein n=1 Tax=Streptococcus anginosus TaxID=1328 RepID=UPI00195E2849|nr:phage major capsid protein [Streptococcus anginosus]VTY23587.1 Phage capsid family protein [Streptococcus anginosus]
MPTLQSGDIFPVQTVQDIFSKVKGHSTIAKLSSQEPIPFTGTETFIFNLEGNAEIIGEGQPSKAGNATMKPKVVKPVLVTYQARVSQEFVNCSEEKQLSYLKSFIDGLAKKVAQAVDIASFHGLEPKSMTDASFKATNSFDGLITGNVVTYDAEKIDENIDAAVTTITANDGQVTGIALSPAAGAALGKIKVNGVVQYPEYRFGQNPASFYGMQSDVNKTLSTVASGAKKDHAIVGDFENAFKWGYAENIPLEIIEYGDPDGAGRDLKRYREVCLRTEVYVGWGILDEESFARVEA